MRIHFDHPFVIFLLVLVLQVIAAFAGDFFRKRAQRFKEGERHDFDTVRVATLTLLALIIGFTFSMAVTRYDLRKTLEEAEANAIGTEYLRTDLLPGDAGGHARELLKQYVDLRITFYKETNASAVEDINQRTANLQTELWNAVVPAANMQPTPVMALVVSGMNDVINSQGYTQAAWWNRIPAGAWAMMALMAISCNVLVGFGERRKSEAILFVLPVIVSAAFFLIADLDNPRGGVIRVHPQNLQAAVQSLQPH